MVHASQNKSSGSGHAPGPPQTVGLFVTTPRLFVPAKNSTLATKYVKYAVSAARWMSAGARNIEPSCGVTISTVGAALGGGGQRIGPVGGVI